MANSASPGKLLKSVSRSFYLTLRVLPRAVRNQIGLAYLLARTSDTIADTALVPLERRLQALRQFADRVAGTSRTALDLRGLAEKQGSPGERALLEGVEKILSFVDTLSREDAALIRQVLAIIIGGQKLDLQRFSHASKDNIIALEAEADLDDYTYRVAGCVGEFWTHMCRTHVFPNVRIDMDWLLKQGIRFGKGLQLVNILRDLPRDFRQGRCYLPKKSLKDIGLEPIALLDPRAENKLRPVYDHWLWICQGHLMAGWEYTNALPVRFLRVKLACAWPVLIGLRTVALLQSSPILDPARVVKISRQEVRSILMRSIACYPFQQTWRNLAPAALGGACAPPKRIA